MIDEIIAEVRKNRDEITGQYEHDLDKIFKSFQKEYEDNVTSGKGDKYVSFPPKRPGKKADGKGSLT